MMVNSNAKSEFGGGRGRIFPLPHDFRENASEHARLIRATEPTDPVDTEDAALIRERELEGRTNEQPS
jgi:hypothetical protein